MALIHSPRVVTDGLILYYDMQNTKKSWRGKPTTNLQVNPSLASGTTNYGQYGPFPPTLIQVDSVPTTPGNSRNVLQVRCSTTDWGQCFYWIAPSLSAGTTYTISYYARALETGNISVWFSNQNGSGDQNNLSHGQTITPTWQRFSHTATLDIAKNIVYVWGTNGATWQIADIQIEANNFATSFVQGIRSNTQAILDLTNNNIITTTELTYESNGNIKFDGSNDYVTISTFVNKPTTQITCETWIKPTRASVGTGFVRGAAISSTNSMYLGIIDSTDGGNTFSMHWANQTSVNRLYNWNGSIPNNAWSHLVGTYDGSTTRAYLNGIEIWSASQSGTIPDGTYVLGTYGGGLQDGVHNLNGYLDNAKIYNRALSATEVQQNFNAQRGIYGL